LRDKTVVLVLLSVALVLVSMSVVPASAFVYPDGSMDDRSETFGPRIDRILIKMYEGIESEIVALQGGDIDITDWALTLPLMEDLAVDPNVAVLSYGGEAGYYEMNYNENDGDYLGNPPDPTYPNPVAGRLCPTAVPEMRQAFSHLIDRVALCAGPGEGLYDPIFTAMPSYMAGFVHPDIKYGGLLEDLAYPPSISEAANLLTQGGFLNTSGGSPRSPRYWDRNSNGVYDGASEDINIIFYSRADKLRKGGADFLCAGLDNPKIDVPYTRYEVSGGEAWQKCMVEKDYNIYTSGWIFIGPDPDYLWDLYSYDNYYHPEDPPNFQCSGWKNPVLNVASLKIKYAANDADALNATLWFQEEFAKEAVTTPLGSTSAPKAYFKTYTGGTKGVAVTPDDGENKYRGASWTHICNQKGLGINSWYTTMNAYPEGYYFGDGSMTMRYGWKETSMPETLNPLYSSWYWEFEILDRCYDYLADRNPYTLGPYEVPLLAEGWTIGTWQDPTTDETKSKLTVSIRPDATWRDGTPFTVEDVYFTFIELPQLLDDVGAPATWWDPATQQMESFTILDKYTVEILLKVQSVWAVGWVLGTVMVPKHIWKPLAEAGPTVVTADMADPDLMGTGAFMLESLTPATSALLVRVPDHWNSIDKCVNSIVPPLEGITLVSADYTGKTAPTVPYIFAPHKVKPSASVKYPQGDPAGTVTLTVKVPLSNLNWNFEEDVDKTIELVKPDASVVTVVPKTNIVIPARGVHTEELTLNDLGKGKYTLKVTVEIASGEFYNYVTTNLASSLWPAFLGPKTVYVDFWVTVPEDIGGAGTPGVPVPDGKVDMKDIGVAAKAFGTFPGHPRWNSAADVNGDYKVDMKDIGAIAKKFGWG